MLISEQNGTAAAHPDLQRPVRMCARRPMQAPTAAAAGGLFTTLHTRRACARTWRTQRSAEHVSDLIEPRWWRGGPCGSMQVQREGVGILPRVMTRVAPVMSSQSPLHIAHKRRAPAPRALAGRRPADPAQSAAATAGSGMVAAATARAASAAELRAWRCAGWGLFESCSRPCTQHARARCRTASGAATLAAAWQACRAPTPAPMRMRRPACTRPMHDGGAPTSSSAWRTSRR